MASAGPANMDIFFQVTGRNGIAMGSEVRPNPIPMAMGPQRKPTTNVFSVKIPVSLLLTHLGAPYLGLASRLLLILSLARNVDFFAKAKYSEIFWS